ncbi:UvrD-helicase domain-containing protein [Herbiconiux sp. P15]|uniref:UvrD-helicase domain-containing protein n=1 Tax=Herbiconiux liukaitaii TaxID=3342799 RepID=UPI0035B95E3C
MSDAQNAISPGNWLSVEQQAVASAGTNIFLRACPGSGKTRTVAARVALETDSGRKVALLSYTRTGAKEISAAVARQHGTLLSGDHFVGTIHSFLQKFVLHPFGHLFTGSQVSVMIDPAEADRDSPVGLNLSDFQFDVDGALSRVRRKSIRRTEVDEARSAKESNAIRGYLNYEDAIFASMMVLRLHPHIAVALASRFDEIIVDEAQDTSALQLECLRLIAGAGLTSLMLVGDYDQSIYGFSGASPEGCEKLALDLGLDLLTLTENYRSSQAICNVAAAFRGGGIPDSAVGEHANIGIPPQIIFYSPGEEPALARVLDQAIGKNGLTAESLMVLVRASALADRIRGESRPRIARPILDLLEARLAAFLTLDQYRELEQILIQRSFGVRNPNVRIDRVQIRNHVIELVNELPELEGDLGSWARESMIVVNSHASSISPTTYTGETISIPADWSRYSVEEPGSAHPRVAVETIHKAKGMSIDAVMLVAEKPSEDWHTSNASAWSASLVAGQRDLMTEETRLAYVALSRARQFFVLALPHDTTSHIVQRYVDIGFSVVSYETSVPTDRQPLLDKTD